MSIKFLCAALLLCAAVSPRAENLRPHVDAHIDPAKSFFAEHVHYAFPHQFAKVSDSRGQQWELAYADLFRGDAAARASAPVLVLLHGRAMNSGYWGTLLEAPLAAGWRVIPIDWSNTGKSLPRNLHLPVNRSLEDARHMIHQLVVEQLGIRKASYLGHSLGGQVAAGYALRYPDNVDKLVLYAPGGLESTPEMTVNGVRLDDPALADSPQAFAAAWEKLRDTISMGATAEAVERAFYTSRPGTKPYMQRGSELAGFIVASRAGALRGHPAELERLHQAYTWDSISSLMETRAGDENSLNNRLSRIKTPTLLALGVKEPTIPVPGTGNTNLVTDVVQPFYTMARLRKAPVQIKLYADAGHFIHTDLPEKFSADVLAFLQTGQAAPPLYAGDPQTYLPPPRAALQSLPEDIRHFKRQYEQAVLSQDLEAVRQLWRADFREDGRTREDVIAFFKTFISGVSRWELIVFGIERKDDLLVLDMEVRHTFGTTPVTMVLKQQDNAWRVYGNQQ